MQKCFAVVERNEKAERNPILGYIGFSMGYRPLECSRLIAESTSDREGAKTSIIYVMKIKTARYTTVAAVLTVMAGEATIVFMSR